MITPGDAGVGEGINSPCDLVQGKLGDYKSGLLLPADAQQVAGHLADCAHCTQEAAFDRVFQLAVPRLPVAVPPSALFEQIALATYAAPPRRTFREIVLGYLAPPTTRLALGTAFAVGIAALIVPHLMVTDPAAPPLTGQAEHRAGTSALVEKKTLPTTPVAPSTIARTDVPAVKAPIFPVKREPQVSAKGVFMTPKLLEPNVVESKGKSLATRPLQPADRLANPAPLPVGVQPKTTVASAGKSVKSAPHGEGVPSRASHPLVQAMPSVTKGVETVVAQHKPVKEMAKEAPAPVAVEPDMEHATQVAVAPMPERTSMPEAHSENNGASEAEMPSPRSLANFRFNAGRGGAKSILSSRSARDVSSGGTGTLSVVSAPAKI